jgi:hypothetical protein
MMEYVVYNGDKSLYEGNNLEEATRMFEGTTPSKMQVSSFDPGSGVLTISEHANWAGRTKLVDTNRYSGARLRALEKVLRER